MIWIFYLHFSLTFRSWPPRTRLSISTRETSPFGQKRGPIRAKRKSNNYTCMHPETSKTQSSREGRRLFELRNAAVFFFWPLNIRTACIIPLRAVCQMVFFCLFSWFLCYISGLVFVFRIKMKVFACFVVLAAVCAAAQAQFANGRILEPPVPSLCAQRVIHERRPDGKSLFLNLIFIDLTKRPN